MGTGKLPACPGEQAAHCARVGELSRRVARILRLGAETENALAAAASAHSDGPGPRFRVPPAGLAALEILEACDGFDESVEFSLFEGTSIAGAIAAYFAEPPVAPGSAVLRALRELATPRWKPAGDTGIPVFPRAAARLMETSEERVSAFELETIVGSDPAFTALLLGAANSAYFGGRGSVTRIGQAVLRIGVPFSRKLLLSACLGRLFHHGAMTDVWRHSRTVAGIAHELAAKCGVAPDVAYVAGLLHDVGRLVTRCATGPSRERERELLEAGFPLVYTEALVFGSDHAEMGGELLNKWKLPTEIVEAVTMHHRPEKAKSPLAGVLYLAEEQAVAGGAGESLSSNARALWAGKVTGMDQVPEIAREGPLFALAC